MQIHPTLIKALSWLVGIDNVDDYRRRDVLHVVWPEFTILWMAADVPHLRTRREADERAGRGGGGKAASSSQSSIEACTGHARSRRHR